MRKIFFGAVLLFLSGCANYSLTTPFVDRETPNGGIIWSHYSMSNSSPQNLQIVANANCSRRGFGYAQIRQIQIGALFSTGEFNKYEFDCKSGNQPDQIDNAKDTCTRIGFRTGTTEHSNCTLELVKKQSQSGNNTIVIQNDGSSSQEMIDRGLDMISGKRGVDGQLKTPTPSMQLPKTYRCTEMVISRNPYMTKQVCN